MKQLLLVLTMFFLVHSISAQQSFNAKGNNALSINIPNSDFLVQQTKAQSITVDVEISVNYPKAVIDQLQKVDRYKVVASPQEGTLVFTTPNLKQGVTIGGKALTEKIKINVKVPTGFSSKGTTILKDKNLKTIEQAVQVNIRFVYPKEQTVAKSKRKSTDRLGSVKSSSSGKVPPGTTNVQALYGDIIIGNMPIDDFYD